MFHGLLDNAASFSHLIQHLPDVYCYKSFDLPGHGKSTPFPQGLPIHSVDNLITYKIVLDHYKKMKGQEKFTIIGHSWGGQIALFFTLIYPEYTKSLVLLDTIAFYPVYGNNLVDYYLNVHEQYFNLIEKLSKNKRPDYTYEEALEKITTNRRHGTLKKENAYDLLERCLEKTEGGKYRFRMDPRLQFFMNPEMDLNTWTKFIRANRIRCPVLVILASESKFQTNYFKPVLNELAKGGDLTIKNVKGDHNVHKNSPELVGPSICAFLWKKSKL